MPRIVDPSPDRSIERFAVCKECGTRLAYVPIEVRTITYSCMGHNEEDRVIDCPKCGSTVTV